MIRFQVKARTFTTKKRAHEHARQESKSTGRRLVVLDCGMAVAAYMNGKRDTRNWEKTDALIHRKFADAPTGELEDSQ